METTGRGWVSRNNDMLQMFYDSIDARWGLKTIDYPRELMVADSRHKWGNFTPPVYAHALKRLGELKFQESAEYATGS